MIRLPTIAAATLALSPVASGAQPAPTVAAAPMHTSGATPTYPRLTRLADAKAMARVNAALAAQEKMDRDSKTDCYAQIRDQKEKPTADSYSETVDVSYLSQRFMGVNAVASYDCGGAYPTNGAEAPLTFDLATGVAVDPARLFKRGFLPVDGADEKTPPSVLTRLYRARYRRGEKKPDDCDDAIKSDDPFAGGAIFWLDARRGLIVQPDFPHAVAACADEMALTPADLAPWLANAALLADLKATVTPARR